MLFRYGHYNGIVYIGIFFANIYIDDNVYIYLKYMYRAYIKFFKIFPVEKCQSDSYLFDNILLIPPRNVRG